MQARCLQHRVPRSHEHTGGVDRCRCSRCSLHDSSQLCGALGHHVHGQHELLLPLCCWAVRVALMPALPHFTVTLQHYTAPVSPMILKPCCQAFQCTRNLPLACLKLTVRHLTLYSQRQMSHTYPHHLVTRATQPVHPIDAARFFGQASVHARPCTSSSPMCGLLISC